MFKYGVISGPYFPVFGLNTERYFVYLRIQSEYRTIQTRNYFRFWTLSTQCILSDQSIAMIQNNLTGATETWFAPIPPKKEVSEGKHVKERPFD